MSPGKGRGIRYYQHTPFPSHNMHDIISISNKIDHPDMFLTMTRYATWHEIKSALLPEEKAQDRPDLAARAFRIKLWELISYVIDHVL